MPRSGDIYGPPAGSKGTPGTTIQSSKYNALVDDLTADANLARPITAGGTGATNATQARLNLGANDSSNQTAGTLSDARLPGTMATKTFTDKLIIRGFAPIVEWRETDVAGTAAWYGVMDSVGFSFRYQDLGTIFLDMRPTGVFEWLGNTIWHRGNDGPASGMDSDLLDGQQGAFYQNSSNQNAGTLSDARLPSVMSGKTFFGSVGIGAAPGNSFENGKALAIGDSDTGLRQNGDGILELWANNQVRMTVNSGQFDFTASVFRVNGVAVVRNDGGSYGINITGASAYAASAGAAQNAGSASALKNSGSGQDMTFSFSGNSGQPTWVWGGENPSTQSLWSPAEFSVANSARLNGQLSSFYTDIPARLGYVPANSGQQVIAGAGLTGGGNLAADRTVAIGTPSNITNSTGNSATGTTHTHALGFVASEVYTGNDVNNLVFPLGESILVRLTAGVDRNAAVSGVYLTAGSTQSYSNAPNGTALSGVWRARGMDSNSGSGNAQMKRTA